MAVPTTLIETAVPTTLVGTAVPKIIVGTSVPTTFVVTKISIGVFSNNVLSYRQCVNCYHYL